MACFQWFRQETGGILPKTCCEILKIKRRKGARERMLFGDNRQNLETNRAEAKGK